MVWTMNVALCGTTLRTATTIIGVLYAVLFTSLLGFEVYSVHCISRKLEAQDLISTFVLLGFVVVSILLTVGAYQESAELLLPWICHAVVNACVALPVFLAHITIKYTRGQFAYASSLLVAVVISAGLHSYVVLVALSLYRLLDKYRAVKTSRGTSLTPALSFTGLAEVHEKTQV